METKDLERKPDWLKVRLPIVSGEFAEVKDRVRENKLHTICESGKCPNIAECWKRGTATFMILGDVCTRACRFCNVKTGKPGPLDWDEPLHVANAINLMKLKHAVITSVDRDDLEDGGSEFWAKTVSEIKRINPDVTIEVLIPDFQGVKKNLQRVIDSAPEIISHNLETVERLTKSVRIRASYRVSLDVIKYISDSGTVSKSGIMLGLGESDQEVLKTFDDLLSSGCKILSIGQYLRPTEKHLKVTEYVTPEKFRFFKEAAIAKGFKKVESSPLVRSSYHAETHLLKQGNNEQ